MNASRACLLLGLLFCAALARADEDSYLSEGAPEALPAGKPACDSECCDPCPAGCFSFSPGWFLGVGGSYNSVKVDQSFTGEGVTNIYENSELVAVGAAGGPAPPFHDTLTTFAPVAQIGFVKPLDCQWSCGGKFAYKYLGLNIHQQNVDAPQTGVYTQLNDPSNPTTFTGNATVLSVQTSVNHELSLIGFLSHPFSRGRFYVGGGPVAFETATRFYGLESHANLGGVPTNIGGLPLNLASNNWMWGGMWQLGTMYCITPSCFFDISYDFAVTGFYTENFPTPVSNTVNGVTYDTNILYSNTTRIWAQSLNVVFCAMF